MDENAIKEITRLSNAAAGVSYFDQEDRDKGRPAILVPSGMVVVDLEYMLPAPTRIKKTEVFISLESFIRYVNAFKLPGTFIRLKRSGDMTAVIDAPLKHIPEWGQHLAEFKATYSERWALWDDIVNEETLSQSKFAEFIEDNTTDFFAPKAGEMLDIARTLELAQNCKFASALKDVSKGDVSLSFERNTLAKAGEKGDLSIPSKFTIMIPVLEGEQSQAIELRLRYELKDGHVTFSFEILRRQQLLNDVLRAVHAAVKNETAITPFMI